MNDNRYCVIMCGGVGSRFWPYSRSTMPKQFIDFFGTGRSLLQLTVERLHGVVPPRHIILLTNAAYAPIIARQLPDFAPEQILFEPARRNTAPCIAWASYHIHALDPNARIMVAPSDHLILDVDTFRDNVNRAFDYIDTHDDIVTMGIKPNRPETGYGYIQAGKPITDDIRVVKTFTEKPNLEMAQVFLSTGEFFWNSGMFFWSSQCIMDALHQYAPDITAIMDRGSEAMGTPREQAFIQQNFAQCPSISIDYAVLEKASNVAVQCVDFGWSDLGTWGALWDLSPKNADGNVTQRCRTLLYDCHNNMIAVQGRKLIVAAGLDDYIVADTPDVLLIVPRADEQRIRHIVKDAEGKFDGEFI